MYEHHEFANLFPMMDGAQWGNFLADVEANGVQEPVWLFEGKILDGRNRAKAAHLCEKSFTTKDFIGTREQALCFVVSRNLHRRHLDESQRAMVGARLKPLFEAEAHERQGQRTDLKKPIETPLFTGSEPAENLLPDLVKSEPIHAQQKAAEAVNVGKGSIHNAETVLKQGTPELVKAVESGQVAVSAAATVAKNTTKEEQEELIQQGPVAIKEKARDIRAHAEAARQAIPMPTPKPIPTGITTQWLDDICKLQMRVAGTKLEALETAASNWSDEDLAKACRECDYYTSVFSEWKSVFTNELQKRGSDEQESKSHFRPVLTIAR